MQNKIFYYFNQLNYKLYAAMLLTFFLTACGGSSGGSDEPNDAGNGGNNDGTTTQYTLSTTVTGSGTVISSPAGMNCNSSCSSDFDESTMLALTAVADSGFVFESWGGACNGSGVCNVQLSANQNVSANFQQPAAGSFTLNIETSTGGTVYSSPAGILCGVNCSANFASDVSVSLSPTADNGYIFDGWTGDCSGSVSCDVSMSQNRNVSATFVLGSLSIADMGRHQVTFGDTFIYQPVITGGASICRKDLGHDDVQVDSETGKITWDTSGLNFGRGFYIRIKCSNFNEAVYASMVVHVDRLGGSKIIVAGEDGISPYMRVAALAMTSGDTLVMPDGEYAVSVTADESYENAFKSTAPTNGTSTQYSTVMAASPGGVTINGEAHGSIGKQKNAFQLSANDYVAIVGFVAKNVQRESFTTTGGHNNRLLLDFFGGAGAGTWGNPCSNFSEAALGQCSNAGIRINSGNPLIQNSYDWGHNRYGIMTRSTEGSLTRRSFVRLDEHKGDQPYGGFSNYCAVSHLSQDNTVFDSLAIAAPHYKNYAGLETYPATGCEFVESTLKTSALLAVNNKLSLSLMDSKAGVNNVWEYIVAYDSEGTCTPQTDRCGNWLLQSDKPTDVSHSFFGKARAFLGGTSPAVAFGGNINLNVGVLLQDIPNHVDTVSQPQYLPETQLYFRGRYDTFYGDIGYDTLTTARRWPIPGEDIIAKNMRSYHNPVAFRVGGGTVDINGNRGAVATGENMSEYFWGYINDKIPPLVVRVKNKGSSSRVAWEHLSGSRRNAVTGWKVICVSAGNSELASLPVEQLTYTDTSTCTQFAVKAIYVDGDSGIAYTEVAQ